MNMQKLLYVALVLLCTIVNAWAIEATSSGLPNTADAAMTTERDGHGNGGGNLDSTSLADSGGYRFTDNRGQAGDTTQYNWIELKNAPGATRIAPAAWLAHGNSNDGYYSASIGFDFPFYGSNYSTAHISTNGLVMFSNPYIYTAGYECLPSTMFGAAVCAYWCNLDVGAAPYVVTPADTGLGVWFKSFGSYFVAEWDSVPHASPVYGKWPAKFQVILFPDGKVKTQYQVINTLPNYNQYRGDSVNARISVGIQRQATGNYFLKYFCNGQPAGDTIRTGRAIWFFPPPPATHDFSCLSVSSPLPNVFYEPNSIVPVSALFKNLGTFTEQSPVKYLWNGEVPVAEITTNLAPNGTEAHTFGTNITMPSVNGTYTLKVFTDLLTDAYPHNDTIPVPVTVRLCYDEVIHPSTYPFQRLNDMTCGFGDKYSNTCLGTYDDSQDHVYQWIVDEEGEYRIVLNAITYSPWDRYWASLLLTSSCPPTTLNCLAWDHEFSGQDTLQSVYLLPGTYYLMADKGSTPADCIHYNLFIQRQASCSSLPLCGSPTESEPNEACAAFDAYILGCNDSLFARHCVEADTDWFKIIVPGSQKLTVSLFDSANQCTGTPHYLRYSLYKSNCVTRLGLRTGLFDSSFVFMQPFTYANCDDAADTVLMQVWGIDADNTGSYRVPYKVTTGCAPLAFCGTPTESEPNGSCMSPDLITLDLNLNPVAFGLHCSPADSDWYDLSIPAMSSVTIKIYDGDDCLHNPATITAFNVQDDTCGSHVGAAITDSLAIANTELTPIVRHILVQGLSWTAVTPYKLLVLPPPAIPYCGSPIEAEPNDNCTVPDAHTLVCEDSVFAVHNPAADSDFYQITVPAGITVSLTIWDGIDCSNSPAQLVDAVLYGSDCSVQEPATQNPITISRCNATTDTTVYLCVVGHTPGVTTAYKIVTACVSTPKNLTAIRDGQNIILRWSPNGEGVPYQIFSALNADGPFDRLVGTTSANTLVDSNAVGTLNQRQFYIVRHCP